MDGPFDMSNRVLEPYLAATDRILISVVSEAINAGKDCGEVGAGAQI
jgi:hypothetical protein